MTSTLAPVESPDVFAEPPARAKRAGVRLSPRALAIVALIAIPTAVFAGADAFGGHLLLNGDNLIQSYPLRVLVGSDIRHGVMPTWDPWIWGGTPLLSGLNAGAFYPTTLLFAVLGSHAAWVIGEIFVFSSVGVGTFLFFSDSGISVGAALCGAAVFTFGGAIAVEASVHTDMAEGLASLPWVLLAIRRIALDGRWRWSVLLGLAFALTILGGAPEAILDVAILGLVYGAVRLSIDPGCWTRLASRGVVAGLLAFGITAALWLPALHFIDASQRANASISFASENAFPISAGLLGVIPYLEGGFGLFSQAPYFGHSNLGELGFYVGILPVIAFLSLWTREWRSRLPRGEQRCWYVVFVVGALLAVGAGTPLEHVLYHIPFYGEQRDSGRNIVDVDFAASALFAWWLDGGRRRSSEPVRSRTVVAFAPFTIVVVVGVWFAVSQSSLWTAMRVYAPPASARTGIGDAIALAAVLTLVGGSIAWARNRLGRRVWLAAVGGFAAVDLALFALGSFYFVGDVSAAPGRSNAPLMNIVKAHLSSAGRYVVYDPNHFDPVPLQDAAEPDVNIVDQVMSFSGYGAIVGATFANDTGTHVRAGLDQNLLAAGDFAPLGLQVVVTVPEEFLLPIAAPPSADGSIHSIAEQPGVDPELPGGSFGNPDRLFQPMKLVPARPAITSGQRVGWLFGTALRPSAAFLTFVSPDRGQLIRVGAITRSGAIDWQPTERLASGAHTASLRPTTSLVTGLVVELVKGPPLGPLNLAVEAKGHSYIVAGPLSTVITPQGWTEVGAADRFTVFRATSFDPKTAWVQPTTLTEPVGDHHVRVPTTSLAVAGVFVAKRLEIGSAKVTASGADSATIDVRSPTKGLLVWSTSYDKGWRAEIVSPDGRPREATVRAVGLALGVLVPKGTSVVRFSYRPVGFSTGLEITYATAIASLVAVAGVFVYRRRRKRPPAST